MNRVEDILLYACASDIIVDFIEVCEKNNFFIKAIISNQPNDNNYVSSTEKHNYNFHTETSPFLVPLFTPYNRHSAVQEALKLGLTPIPLLSDRNNDLPTKFKHGIGCFINKRVVIGAESVLGDYVLINRGACLGHHLILEDYVSIGPGVTTGGGVTIKKGALIGTGATILPGIIIGENAIVGAGSVVTKNVNANTIVIGNPSTFVSDNKKYIQF